MTIKYTAWKKPKTMRTFDGYLGLIGLPSPAWSSPNNVLTDNNIYASFSFNSQTNQFTDFLMGYNFGFNVPTAATILGFQVRSKRYATLSDSTPPNGVETIRLFVSDAASSITTVNNSSNINYTSVSSPWGSSASLVQDITADNNLFTSYFGSGSTISWTASKVRSTNFGVAFAPGYSSNNLYTGNGYMDYFEVRVVYEGGTTGGILACF